ncbi:ABC transporter ATP-binding protein [Mycoplasma bradburyae]|uniref:ABC transporter ATP-binding protein n=1 Tax=Mycoplasma bradburyae TaxID=2963128 RepID=A0AAW6HP20_9MOLU|nr:ABC transporter ATP-binding protein [Mycoplasma bradburyae]MDC4183439.1 ABC transporter ATP-binding protein [Mycoplasma bradburyae]UTS71210.1 ABC transporter ATP-binding protein [Mycoplasma bradburyae]
MHNQKILEVINLTKKFKRNQDPVINCINFSVKKNQYHVFIGANGAGKTTTIKTIIGAFKKTSGTILINGIDSEVPDARKCIGYVPEVSRFSNNLNTFEYLVWMGRLSGLTKEQAQHKVTKKLEEFNMIRLAKANPNKFSSGQKKKIILIQSLLSDPELLILDEPTANLDPKARIEFMDFTKQLQEKNQTSIFISSHVLTEVDQYANSITILDGGKVIFSGDLNEINQIDAKYKKYVIKLTDINNAKKLFSEAKINWIFNKNKNEFYLYLEDKKITNSLLHDLIVDKNTILAFYEHKFSINEIYEQYIKIGSVQTAK